MTPAFLLRNPELVTPAAPWCVVLDNLELGTVMLAQPWLAGDGLRRAELERRLERMAGDLPLGGPIYFQRVKRMVARLEEVGILEARGGGRTRRFLTRPEGFAAFLLNLRVPRADPTLDGSEFELKRALVAMWNLTFERSRQLGELSPPTGASRFLDRLENLEVLGRRIVDPELLTAALDVLRLIDIQRRHVERLLDRARQRLTQLESESRRADLELGRLVGGEVSPGVAALLAETPDHALALVRELATATLPRLHLRAAIGRYRHYLGYLDTLEDLHDRVLHDEDTDGERTDRHAADHPPTFDAIRRWIHLRSA